MNVRFSFLPRVILSVVCTVVFCLLSGEAIHATGSYELCEAARRGNLTRVQHLVDTGVDVNVKGPSGDMPLHAAAGEGNREVVEYLVGAGADINVANESGRTPLRLAAVKGHREVVEGLLRMGAVHTLHTASAIGDLVEVQRLMGGGADVNVKGPSGDIPLHCAALNGHREVVEYLLGQGADVGAVETNGYSGPICLEQI